MRGKAKGKVRPPIPEVEATIEALADDGRGVARIDGKVAFVAGGLPGERVRIAFERSRRQFDHAQVVEVLSPSPDRVEPPCRHFGICGGCSLQHLDPEAQIKAKGLLLLDKLERFGGVKPAQWLEPVHAEVRHYRRSARLGVRDVPAKGGIIIGFRERRSHFLTPLTECVVLDRRASSLLPALRELISALACRERLPQVEVACGDDEWALVFRHLVPLTGGDVERLRAFGKEHGVRIYGQAGGPDTVSPLWPEDPGPLHYAMPESGLRMAFLPTDFIQVNALVNRTMVRRAIELLGACEGELVLDLFCGLGNFTLPLAKAAAGATVIGVESDERLVAAATENAARNGIGNASFRRADLYDESAVKGLWSALKPQRLLLDPPRSGAIEVLKLMPEKNSPARIVYVSCNPATLARDAEYLVNARGYRLEAAGVLDMFPHTSHVESIAVFEKSGRKK